MGANALIVCIGNELVADDGVGSAIYKALAQRVLPPGVRLLLLGLGGIDLLELMAGERLLIVVDAVQLGGEPGTVVELVWQEVPQLSGRPVSGHGIGLNEAMALGSRLYPERMVAEAWLIGIEGACFDQLGEGLSDAVVGAIEPAVARILDRLRKTLCLSE